MGKDVESMYGDIGRWMGAVSDVNHAAKMSKNPPLFKKLFAGSSVEQEAMDAFAAKKKAEAMEEELRTWINMVHGPNAWNRLCRGCRRNTMDACTKRNNMIYAHKNYRLEVKRDQGKFYNNNKLIFQGFAFKALMMFIDNCNDNNVRSKFKSQLSMREQCKFKERRKDDKEKTL